MKKLNFSEVLSKKSICDFFFFANYNSLNVFLHYFVLFKTILSF